MQLTPFQRFIFDLIERTAKTFVQGFLSVVTLDVITGAGDLLTFKQRIYAGLLAGGYSILTSFASKPLGAKDSASLLPEAIEPPK